MDIYDKYGLALEALSKIIKLHPPKEVKDIIDEFLESTK